MVTKLTLTVEKEIIETAKQYAVSKGRSLSSLVENYLKSLVQRNTKEERLSPTVEKLLGSVKAPKDFDYKKMLETEINKKYKK